MKELENYFVGRGEVSGFEFEQIAKSDKAYVYRKTDLDTYLVTYEVFERKENTMFNCISYPKSNSFGVWAWDYSDRDKAMKKFSELNLKEQVIK